MSIGGGSSSSRQSSSSSSSSQSIGLSGSQSYLDPTQAAAQNQLQQQFLGQQFNPYSQAGDAAARENIYGSMGISQNAGAAAQQAGAGGNLFGVAGAAGLGHLAQFAQQNNPYVNSQIQQFGQDIGRQYREQIMPGIGADFQNAGQRGSSRQGISEGLAAQGAMQQFTRGATDIRNNAYNQQLTAANALAQGGLQGYQTGLSAQNAGYGQQNAAMANINQGAGVLQGGAQNQYASQFMPFEIGGGLMGNPAVLSQSFGFDMSQAEAESQSKGKGGGSNLSVGLVKGGGKMALPLLALMAAGGGLLAGGRSLLGQADKQSQQDLLESFARNYGQSGYTQGAGREDFGQTYNQLAAMQESGGILNPMASAGMHDLIESFTGRANQTAQFEAQESRLASQFNRTLANTQDYQENTLQQSADAAAASQGNAQQSFLFGELNKMRTGYDTTMRPMAVGQRSLMQARKALRGGTGQGLANAIITLQTQVDPGVFRDEDASRWQSGGGWTSQIASDLEKLRSGKLTDDETVAIDNELARLLNAMDIQASGVLNSVQNRVGILTGGDQDKLQQGMQYVGGGQGYVWDRPELDGWTSEDARRKLLESGEYTDKPPPGNRSGSRAAPRMGR